MKRVYVAGAYSADNVMDVFENMRKGMNLGLQVFKLGFAPFVPWFDYQFLLLKDDESIPIEKFYQYTLAWLEASDAVLVVPGWENSTGTKGEIARAKELGIPVFYRLMDLVNYFYSAHEVAAIRVALTEGELMDEQTEALLECLEATRSNPDSRRSWLIVSESMLKKGYKKSPEAWRSYYRRIEKDVADKAKRQAIHTEPTLPEGATMEEMFDVAKINVKHRKKFSISSLQADKAIDADTPIAVTFMSDFHIGSRWVDYDTMEKHIKLVEENGCLYVAFDGDMTDNFIPGFKDARAVVNQIMTPQEQLLVEEQILIRLRDKIIVKGGGNHDEMASKKTSLDPEYFILRDGPFFKMPLGGLINLTVGNVTYKILIKHTYRYQSSLNQFNSHHRMLEILEPKADIVVQGHQHNPGIEVVDRFEFEPKSVVSIRTGTYKIHDPFSVQNYKSGRIGPQTVVLFPDKHKIVPFHGEDAIEDALAYMDGCHG